MIKTPENNQNEESIFQTRLNYLIEERGSSRKELADYVGITRQSISLYLRGERIPDINTLKKICDYFNVSSDWMIGRVDKRTSNITNKQIADRLGLSDYSIDILMTYNDAYGGDYLIPVVNYLIEQEYPLRFEEEWQSIYQHGDILEENGVLEDEIHNILKNKEKELTLEIKEWEEKHLSVLSKIEDYFLVVIDNDDLYITEKSINKSKDFKNILQKNMATVRKIDASKIVDQVFLLEIQETLKKSKEIYLKTKPGRYSVSFAPEE